MGLCCCDLKTGVMVLAILVIIGSLIEIIRPLVTLQAVKLEYQVKMPNLLPSFIAAVVVGLILCGTWLILSILLLIGAIQRNAGMCKFYLIGNPIVYALYIGLYIFAWTTGPIEEVINYVLSIIGLVLGIAICVYLFLVVQAFIKEIKEGPIPGLLVFDSQYDQPYPEEGQSIKYGGNPPIPNQTPSQYAQVTTMNQDGNPPQPVVQ